MSNPPNLDPDRVSRESDLLDILLAMLRERLPPGWSAGLRLSPLGLPGTPDAQLDIRAPDGETTQVIVEAKLGLEPREVEPLVMGLRRAVVDAGLPLESRNAPLIVARFISPRARGLLTEQGASYADATGNIRITTSSPAVFMSDRGSDVNPWREVRDLRSLKGRSASRVVRALCDLRPPLGVREIAERAGASIGSTVRALDFLEREALIVRDDHKQVIDVALTPLVLRWANDFRFTQQNDVVEWFEPRRLSDLVQRLVEVGGIYAVTGSFAANAVAPFADPRLLAIYSPDPRALAEALGVRPAAGQTNVWIVRPPDELPLRRSWEQDRITYAALTQVACDLLDMPGRAPAEGEELLRWLETHQDEWRAD